jgi:AAA+ ATPase superfamily predicted ATPase
MALRNSFDLRKIEREILLKTLVTANSEFIALYGRRRIGKTYLVRETFKTHIVFEFVGTKDSPARSQIENYTRALQRAFSTKIKTPPKNWHEALDLLIEVLGNPARSSRQKKVIFFDELPWLASRKSGFIEALDYLWNSYLSKRNDIVLVVCGSAANWMISNVVNNKGGLHNRITRPPLRMSPFTLIETRDYFRSRNIDLSEEQITELYMVTGGVAYYLNLYERGDSAAQFINRNFFGASSELRDEFDRLFSSLFDKFDTHMAIIKLLGKHSSGLSQKEIAAKLKTSTGGTFTKILTELEKSDFISFWPQLEHRKKDGIFRLVDEYTLFYLFWVDPLGARADLRDYWQKQIGKPRHYSWLGHAFEALCAKHAPELVKSLGVSGLTNRFYSFQGENTQIDMIIDRSDRCMNLCEMKYTLYPYEMTGAEASKLKERRLHLSKKTTKKTQVFLTLVTPQPAVKNKHYLSCVDKEINLSELFTSR